MPALNEDRREINEEFNLIVATNLRLLREANGATLAACAAAADMDMTVLSRIESTERTIKFREAVELAKYLGVDVEYLSTKHRGVSYEWASDAL